MNNGIYVSRVKYTVLLLIVVGLWWVWKGQQWQLFIWCKFSRWSFIAKMHYKFPLFVFVIYSAFSKHGRPVPNYTAWLCVNNLPKVVTWRWNADVAGCKPVTMPLASQLPANLGLHTAICCQAVGLLAGSQQSNQPSQKFAAASCKA